MNLPAALLYPLRRIDRMHHKEFIAMQAACVRSRVTVLCFGLLGMYYGAVFLASFLNPSISLLDNMRVTVSLTVASVLILYLNRKLCCLSRLKFNAFLFMVLLLTIMIQGQWEQPENFNLTVFLLVLLFIALAIPWFLHEVMLIIGLFLTAWWAYFRTRDTGDLYVPSSIFGDDAFLNGVILIGFAAAVSLVIRFKEIERDISNFNLLKEVESKNRQMQTELDLASRIQRTLVPAEASTDRADLAVTYLPVSLIGGDYARIGDAGDGRMIFFISDVTGHGVPAALLVNRLHSEFEKLVKAGGQPGEILSCLNRFIRGEFEGTHMYLSAVCGLIDPGRSEILYSNYGHPPQYVYRAGSSTIVSLEAQTTLLGIGEEDTLYQTAVSYEPGDRILLFTDGILELKNAREEEYGSHRLRAFFLRNSHLPVDRFQTELVRQIHEFRSAADFRDDIFIMTLQIKK